MSTNQRKKAIIAGSNDIVPIVRKFSYDPADGLVQGVVTLKGEDDNAEDIPPGSIITDVITDQRANFTSGGSATVALGYTGAATAFLAATAYNNAAWTGTKTKNPTNPIAVGNGAPVKVLATIATADLTAGAFDVYVKYIPPRTDAHRN